VIQFEEKADSASEIDYKCWFLWRKNS